MGMKKKKERVGYAKLVYEVEYADGSVHTQMSMRDQWDLGVDDAIEMVVGVLVAGGYSESLVRRAMGEIEQTIDSQWDPSELAGKN